MAGSFFTILSTREAQKSALEVFPTPNEHHLTGCTIAEDTQLPGPWPTNTSDSKDTENWKLKVTDSWVQHLFSALSLCLPGGSEEAVELRNNRVPDKELGETGPSERGKESDKE